MLDLAELERCALAVSSFHAVIEVIGRDFRRSVVQPPAQNRSVMRSDQIVGALSLWVLKTSQVRDCITFQGSLLQCLANPHDVTKNHEKNSLIPI